MEPAESSRGTKRPLDAGDDDGLERKPRFPKGKKAKYRDPSADGTAGDIDAMLSPELAAERRARQRHGRHKEEGDDAKVGAADVRGFEVRYKDGVNFVEDGVRIEPFNLEREREEGYFDENGNFVEYARGNEIKDAWLDSVEVDPSYVAKIQNKGKEEEEEFEDLSSDDIGRIKRQIINMLEPGETIIQALKRLKGTSTDKRGKMTEGTKRIFDELTEAAMKLMENGEYNVYSDDRETFEREAAGYERLARARLGLPEVEKDNQASSSLLQIDLGPSATDTSTITTASSNNDDSNFDMFGDDDNTGASHSYDANAVDPSLNSVSAPQDASGTSEAGNGNLDSDYVYDPSSGYYYSSSTGYYYDPNSGCYCSASSGTWYSYNEETGAYKEIVQDEQAGTDQKAGDAIKE